MEGRYNTRSPAVKRLMREAQELSEPTEQYFAQPLDDNLFEWHFTIRGPADSDFQNGIYHGRIILPVDYPMKPPSIIWLTPNGRFETNKKICLSISGHHPESWQPSWSIRTALLAIIGFMPTPPGGAIGSLDYTPEEHKAMAKKSKDWKCPTCGEIAGILLDATSNAQGTSNEAKELAAQINLQGEKPKCKDGECPIEQARLSEMQTESIASGAIPASEKSNVTVNSEESTNTASNNTSTYIGQQPGAQVSPSPQIPSLGQFPPWSTFTTCPYPTMPPVGFPFQYPGMPPIVPMQFPYPPSHYSNMPQQYNWPTPQDTETYSNSQSQLPVSVNNSSNQGNSDGISPTSNLYARTPMSCPVTTNRPQTASSNNIDAQIPSDIDQAVTEKRGYVFKELLNKVNRVGSTTKQEQTVSQLDNSVSPETQVQSANIATSSNPANKLPVGGDNKQIQAKKIVHDEGTDSEVSKSLKKMGDKSVSEVGDTNTPDNSECDVPPIDTDLGPVLEKGACSSTSELEKWKQKCQVNKVLRQRQSATANISPEGDEEGVIEPERTDVSALRQRIEAVSGDTGNRNRLRPRTARVGNINIQNMQNNAPTQNGERSFDFSFYLMIGLFTTSMIILLNRLISFDWNQL